MVDAFFAASGLAKFVRGGSHSVRFAFGSGLVSLWFAASFFV
jgi:hypothetical protein